MAKNKKGGPGSRFKGQRFTRRKGALFENPSGEYGGNNSPISAQAFVRGHGYTLADEARNTAFKRRGAFGPDAKLRYKPVTFISAGVMNPLNDLNVQLTITNQAQENTGAAAVSQNTSAAPELAQDISDKSAHVKSDRTLDVKSDHDGDSSDEVILFKGRDRNRRSPVSANPPKENNDVNSLELRELDIQLQAVEETLHRSTTQQKNVIDKNDYVPLQSKPRGPGKGRKFNQDITSDEDAAVIADYMANIKDWEEGSDDNSDGAAEYSEMGSYSFNILRDIGGTDSDAIPDDVSSEDGADRSSEDEADPENRQRRLEVEDERIARMLAKQEELGLGSADVVLFDGEASDDEWVTATQAAPRRKRKGDSKKAKIVQKKGQYPSAAQMADAFDDLDLMDWHRPSLNNFKRGPPALNVSESELEEAMKSTWQKDRLKKADRKKAREELRSQGLLGKHVDPDDLRLKYRGGMSLDDLANELEAFLLSSREQLILPPLEKGARKTIHTVANKLRIKSQSAGKGRDRYPVLYRSKATLPFDKVTFDNTFDRIRQTWFPRVDVDEKVVSEARILKRAEARNGKSRIKGTVTYRDGDVVGQNAAEIGVENKGRAMLEKMGWSKGMALGSGENKGIMVPITHVVKKTKAGLGDA
ncbi:uncharacterized protein F4822DRAFT_340559 [Hypoxylon trugodes]|uniref:uncharacterized protein n=1 Tax=Hypoxylon trugodes TaxID=326681 RepID=UPI00219BFF9B|nr:uncharacterized protein F4822DRAFT_340559 [Hypoxylon trugodes]KAI1385292.1 hypothetical protein F4822DRAFT_340559 [Hypoxylon trugodes]